MTPVAHNRVFLLATGHCFMKINLNNPHDSLSRMFVNCLHRDVMPHTKRIPLSLRPEGPVVAVARVRFEVNYRITATREDCLQF